MGHRTLLSVIFIVASAKFASASTIYDQSAVTKGATDYYSSVDGFVVSDNFTLSSAATIDTVSWTGGSREGSNLSFYIAISSDVGGQPGTTLFSETVTAQGIGLNLYNNYCELYDFSAALPFTAAAGTEYWLTISAYVGETGYFWNDGSGGDGSSFDTYADTSVGSDQAFTLSNNALDPSQTPEPSSLILAGSGLLAVAGAARRRLRGR